MMVVDASVAVMWVLSGQRKSIADQILQETKLSAPTLIVLEIAHVLLRDARRGFLSVPDYLEMLTDKLPEVIACEDTANLIPQAALIAASHGGAVYDACYVALAQQLNIPLVTADRQQAAIARKAGVEVKLIV